MNLKVAYGPTKKEQEGVWVPVSEVFKSAMFDDNDPAMIKLAGSGAGNLELQKAMARGILSNPRKGNNAVPDFSELTARTYRIYAEYVVLDWKGFTDDDGTEIPYSPEVIIELFKSYPRLFEDIRAFSGDLSNFTKAAFEKAEKN